MLRKLLVLLQLKRVHRQPQLQQPLLRKSQLVKLPKRQEQQQLKAQHKQPQVPHKQQQLMPHKQLVRLQLKS